MLVEAEESYPEASEALDLIGEMFLIERDLPDWRCITDDGLRTRALAQIRDTRQTRTKPLVEALAAWAKAQRALKGSRLGEAVTYLNNQWGALLVFLDDPRVPLSNNSAERSLRGPVVGRKNFAGCKSVRGLRVERAAMRSASVSPPALVSGFFQNEWFWLNATEPDFAHATADRQSTRSHEHPGGGSRQVIRWPWRARLGGYLNRLEPTR